MEGSSLSVGDFYGGGVIFWLDASGNHGLIVALNDQSAALQWYNGTYITTSTTTNAIYAGEIQTAIIVSLQGAGSYAAQACNDYGPIVNNEFYGDWYLPTRYEMNLIYQNRIAVNATAIANGGTALAGSSYWTSNEYSTNNAWKFNFGSVTYGYTGKQATIYVRAIREF